MDSQRLFSQSLEIFPGGVNSPVRNFHAVGLQHPVFIERAEKSSLYDCEGNEYLDFVGSWGPMIHGHAHEDIVNAVTQVAKKGLSFGAPTALETKLALLIQECFPMAQSMRFTSSGTEATMTAIRLARGATRKPYIVKFAGCYHGHHDALLVQAGSGCATFDQLSSQGLLPETAQYTLCLPYNDSAALERCFDSYRGQIAGVIIEPIAGNMGTVPAKKEFLQQLRMLTTKENALLIFDEVMTGFRVAKGGASEIYQIEPDLITLGKIVGGGLPLGVMGGKKSVMKHIAPIGSVYHAGTLSGNPCAVSAGIATLELFTKDFHKRLGEKTQYFVEQVQQADPRLAALKAVYFPGMLSFYCLEKEPQNFHEVQRQSQALFSSLFQSLLDSHIYWPPSLFEAAFLSQAHTRLQLKSAAQSYAKAFLSASAACLQRQPLDERTR